MSTLKIREAIGADRDAILRLVPRLRAFGTTAFHQAADLDEGERRTINQYFDSPPEGARLWVAEEEAASGIAGAAYAQRMIDYFTRAPHAHLGILMVAEQSEGGGVARALMHQVEDWARENRFNKLTLNVFAENGRARGFYEHLEFAPDVVRYAKVIEESDSST